MRTWTRAAVETLCGRCNRMIAVGDPIQELRLHGTLMKDGEATAEISVRTPRVRCTACADEPVPADLPPLEPRSTAIAPVPARPQRRLDFSPGGRS